MPTPLDVVFLILLGPWLMLPAVLANMAPVFLKGKMPLDFGNKIGGRRILGDGKTIEGTIGGTMVGTVVGIIMMSVLFFLDAMDSQWSYGDTFYAVVIIVTFAFGALFGDLIGSFIKRRLNFKRGAKFPVMDQYDLVLGIFILFLVNPLSWSWALDHFILDWHWISLVTVIAGTFIVHRISNIIGYKMGVKDVPW